jgi:molecular chaperone GrpE (heat shock protein)
MSSSQKNDIGNFMVAVGAVVEHQSSNEILLLQRADDNYKPGIWEIGYGRIAQGEDPETALKREFFEETGLQNLQVKSVLTAWHFYRGEEKPENEVVGITFWAQSDSKKVKISREHQAYQWVSPQEALKMVSEETIKEDIEAFLVARAAATEVANAQHGQQRAVADYQNLVRRTKEERSKLSQFAANQLIGDLLQPLEHLSLATEQLNETGLNLVKNQLWQVLSQHGLEEFKPLGEEFDLSQMEVVDHQGDGTKVVSVVRPGFRLNGEVIQHAKVVLGNKK